MTVSIHIEYTGVNVYKWDHENKTLLENAIEEVEQ